MAEGGVRDRAGDALTRAKRRMGLENPSAADDDGNVGIVRGALRALGEGKLDEFVDVLTSDVTWEAPGGNFPGDEALDGRDAVKDQFLGDAGRTFVEFGFKPEKFLDADDENAVVVFGTFFGESAEGETLDEPSVVVFQFSGSEAEHVRVYSDSAKWPEVMTEERERELEEKEKEEQAKKEQEAKGEGDSEDESDDGESKSEGDDDSKSESSDDSKAESGDGSKSESGDDSESESDGDSGGSDRERSESSSQS